MQVSIIPDIISERKIKFFNETDIPIEICGESFSKYLIPFETPFLIIDTFAKKTTKKEEIVSIDLDELKKLEYVITVRRTSRGWFKGQKRIYLIEKKNNILPGSRKVNYIPSNHRLQKDIPNKKIRIVGPNSGVNGFGQWNEIK